MKTLSGIPASPGIAIGLIHVINQEELSIKEITLDTPGKVQSEVENFTLALRKTEEELVAVQKMLRSHLGKDEASIFDAHLHILKDIAISQKTAAIIKNEKKNAAFALKRVVDETIVAFNAMQDDYLRQRVLDVQDVYKRVLNHLVEDFVTGVDPVDLSEKSVFVARSLGPYDFAFFEQGSMLGVVTETGGAASHFAIIARSLDIPAVVGCEGVTLTAVNGATIIIDGGHGTVILNPDSDTLEKYSRQQKRYISREQKLFAQRDLPPITIDGRMIDIAANLELPSEITSILEHGCRNIGLCRTEFLYLLKKSPPTEEEQFQTYSDFLKKMHPGYVIIRTFDLGGDKISGMIKTESEANPALGWRAIRICLDEEDLFRTQLRAILRASIFGNLKVMFPMISSVEELRRALKIYNEVKKELLGKLVPVSERIDVGVMIEVPSAALVADELAKEVDFFSIGTNDLTQFLLAVDRGNKRLAPLFDSHNPAVLKMIKSVINAAHSNGIWVGVCGEMAGNPLSALLLLGMGADELSMNTISVLEIKRIIRSITFDEIRSVVEEALTLESSRKISVFLQRKFRKKVSFSHLYQEVFKV
ncbi:MAG: phosphoenolpyruvate--protein phosphotransferase, partial [Candidatus Raymondbacteria bacterium RifOxyC12_full_50_8]